MAKQHKYVSEQLVNKEIYDKIGVDGVIKEFAYKILGELDYHQIKQLLGIKIINPFEFNGNAFTFDEIQRLKYNNQIKLVSEIPLNSNKIEFYLNTDNSLVEINTVSHSDGDIESFILKDKKVLCKQIKSCNNKITYYSDYLGNLYDFNLMKHECTYNIKDLIYSNFEHIFTNY